MLENTLEQIDRTPRAQLLWLMAGALVLGQLAAVYLLCSHQVSQARARDASLQQRQLAIAQCLSTVRGASRSGCTHGLAPPGAAEFAER
jgi:undecaprenyl pyrophosphate phosphatase UppP